MHQNALMTPFKAHQNYYIFPWIALWKPKTVISCWQQNMLLNHARLTQIAIYNGLFWDFVNNNSNCVMAGLQGCVTHKITMCTCSRRALKKSTLLLKTLLWVKWLRNCAQFGEVCGHLETPGCPLTQTLSFICLILHLTRIFQECSCHVTECFHSIFRFRYQQMPREVKCT